MLRPLARIPESPPRSRRAHAVRGTTRARSTRPSLHGWNYYWKSTHLPELRDDLIDVIAEHAFSCSSPRSYMAMFHLKGAVSRVAEGRDRVREPAGVTRDHPRWLCGGPARTSATGTPLGRRSSSPPSAASAKASTSTSSAATKTPTGSARRTATPVLRPAGGREDHVRPRQRLPPQPEHPPASRAMPLDRAHGRRRYGETGSPHRLAGHVERSRSVPDALTAHHGPCGGRSERFSGCRDRDVAARDDSAPDAANDPSLPAHQLRDLNQVAAGVVHHRDLRGGHVRGRHGELGAARPHPLVVGLDVVAEEHHGGLALLEHRLLVGLGRRVVVERQLQFRAVRVLGDATVSQRTAPG